MTKSKIRADRTKNLLTIVTLLLVLVTGSLLFTLSRDGDESEGVHVDLGALGYEFDSGRAIKKDDKKTGDLRSFLQRMGEKDISLGCTSTYYQVVTASPDEKQILLNYGCDYPNAHMFAVKTSGTWKTISPTNQFDIFGIPLCSHVNVNHISTAIAPVCASSSELPAGKVEYRVR